MATELRSVVDRLDCKMDVTTERSGKQQEFVVGDPTKATYRLVRKIGSGSFGDIYLGINTANGEEVRSVVD